MMPLILLMTSKQRQPHDRRYAERRIVPREDAPTEAQASAHVFTRTWGRQA